MGFLLYRECFMMNRLASNRHSYKRSCYRESFPVNVHFLFQPRKFSHSKKFCCVRYNVYIRAITLIDNHGIIVLLQHIYHADPRR